MEKRDCKDCVNCCRIYGFMCDCRYSYNDKCVHYQVGQYVHRSRANKCERYNTEGYNRDKMFVL